MNKERKLNFMLCLWVISFTVIKASEKDAYKDFE